MTCGEDTESDPFVNGTADVITWDLLLPGAAKITTLAPVPLSTPATHQSTPCAAEVCIYLNPDTLYAVAGKHWKSAGFRHPLTSESVHSAQVTLLWPDVLKFRHAVRLIEAQYLRYKAAKRQKLVALKQTLDKRVVYNENSAAALLNTAKFSDVADLLWCFIVPATGQPNNVAGKALLYAKKVQHSWLVEGWADVTGGNSYLGVRLGKYRHELTWLIGKASDIDKYAADGTNPTRNLVRHLTCRVGARDISTSRNLNRLLDAATCFAYWTTIRQHELAGTLLMCNRFCAAIASDTCTRSTLGSLACLHPELLQIVLSHLKSSDK